MTTKGVQMKFANKGLQPESKINSKWKNVTDTNLEQVDFKDFSKRECTGTMGTYQHQLPTEWWEIASSKQLDFH